MIVAPTGAGKTTMGIELAARLGQRCLILVKSKDLAEQWQQAITRFTGLDCGMIGGGKWIEGEQFTVATVQTLAKRGADLGYGLLLVDECHNAPAEQSFAVINRQAAKYRFGLSATPQRRDGLEFMIHAALGPIAAVVKPNEVEGAVLPVVVERVFYPLQGNPQSWQAFNKLLANDENRCRLVVARAIQASHAGGTAILTSTIEHAERLHQLIARHGRESLLLHGQLPAKIRAERMEAAPVSAEVARETPAATRLLQSIGLPVGLSLANNMRASSTLSTSTLSALRPAVSARRFTASRVLKFAARSTPHDDQQQTKSSGH
ncbi:DEAD/DEAH box helicase [Methylomonas koyamae]|uniref:DEAD/DEAH box helicase n=1 Tax=Methylomonas koyamae TaxID=702114 RepID=UPI001E3936B8|nr:DEAD/DEAH box helicase family protein [Methylomonas koyamae]